MNEEKVEENIPAKKYATIDDFQKIEIKLGTVLSVEVVEGADKLYKLSVDMGEEVPRQILSGIREYVQPEDIIGKQFPFVTNLAPRMLRGFESQGMILAGSDDSGRLCAYCQSVVSAYRFPTVWKNRTVHGKFKWR